MFIHVQICIIPVNHIRPKHEILQADLNFYMEKNLSFALSDTFVLFSHVKI